MQHITYFYSNFPNLNAIMFLRMLRKDKEEVEAIKYAKALEAEKAMYSVR